MNRNGRGRNKGWHRMMQGRGFRITAPREAVLSVLEKEQTHLSAKEIYAKVIVMEPSVGLTTIYRTLEMLAEMGLINHVEIGDKTTRYEISSDSSKHHNHIICTNCRKVIDYSEFSKEEKELFSKMIKNIEKKYNIKITGHNIQFFGICLECEK